MSESAAITQIYSDHSPPQQDGSPTDQAHLQSQPHDASTQSSQDLELTNQYVTAPLNLTLSFDLETLQIPLEQLMPSKKLPDGVMSTRKFKQILSSIKEIGLIEPRSIIKPDEDQETFLLLDGNLRVLALKELGNETAPCLLAKDFETYTYNHRINRLSTVQEH